MYCSFILSTTTCDMDHPARFLNSRIQSCKENDTNLIKKKKNCFTGLPDQYKKLHTSLNGNAIVSFLRTPLIKRHPSIVHNGDLGISRFYNTLCTRAATSYPFERTKTLHVPVHCIIILPGAIVDRYFTQNTTSSEQ